MYATFNLPLVTILWQACLTCILEIQAFYRTVTINIFSPVHCLYVLPACHMPFLKMIYVLPRQLSCHMLVTGC